MAIKRLALLLIISFALQAMAASSVVQPQQSMIVPADRGHSFGSDITMGSGTALVGTTSDNFAQERNGPDNLLPLVRQGTRWIVGATLGPTNCSSTLYDYVVTFEPISWAARDMRYMADPCAEPFPPLPAVDGGTVQPFSIGEVREFPVDALSPSTTYRAPPAGEWMRFGDDVAAGPGWFAVVAQASELPFDESNPDDFWFRVYVFREGTSTPFWQYEGTKDDRQHAAEVVALGQDLFIRRDLTTWEVFTWTGDTLQFVQTLSLTYIRGEGSTFMDGMNLYERGENQWHLTETFAPPAHGGYGGSQRSYARPGLVAIGAQTQWHQEFDPESGEVIATVVDEPGVVYIYRQAADTSWTIHEEVRTRAGINSFGAVVGIDDWDVLIGDPGDGYGRIHVRTVNQWPLADFTWAPEVPLSLTDVAFSDTSIDPEGKKMTFQWDFNGDGEVDSTKARPTWNFATPGPHEVSLRVEDPPGGFNIVTKTVTIENRPPLIDFAFSPPILWRQQVHIADDLSRDLDGEVLAWEWDFGNGKTSNLEHPEIVYAQKGSYFVSLTITDDFGATATKSGWYEVFNHPPVIWLDVPDDLLTLVPFDVTVTAHDPDGALVSQAWINAEGTNVATMQFDHAGIYRIGYTATDDDGDTTTVWRDLVVQNRAPEAAFNVNPAAFATRNPIQFEDQSVDLDGRVTAWDWDFGDGNHSTEPSPVHIYQRLGGYDVVLKVQDDQGAWSEPISSSVDVLHDAPWARFMAVPEGDQFILTDLSYDDEGIASREWRVGDDTFVDEKIWISAPTPTLVSLQVTDTRGVQSTAFAWVAPLVIGDEVAGPGAPIVSEVVSPGTTLAELPDWEAGQTYDYNPPAPEDQTATTADGASGWWLMLLLVPAIVGAVFLVRHSARKE